MKTLLLASALFAGLLFAGSSAAAPVPVPPAPSLYHAFCRTLWLFATPCADIAATMVMQIQALSPMASCDICHYKLVSVTPSAIIANHTSINGLQAENITFSFSPTVMTGGCRVTAQSTSLGYTSLLDDGLNYCNLRVVVSASGLSKSPDFMEITNEWACLGYGLSTCKA